jgi:hypothetical protein
LLERLSAVFAVDKSIVLKMRRCGNLFSLIDVAALVTGKSTDYASQQIRIIGEQFPAVREKITDWKFQGERQRSTPTGDIYVVVELIMLLPGTRASLVRREAATLFVRVYGGDLSLAAEICDNRISQEHLATEEPRDPRRVFGEAVAPPLAQIAPPWPKSARPCESAAS